MVGKVRVTAALNRGRGGGGGGGGWVSGAIVSIFVLASAFTLLNLLGCEPEKKKHTKKPPARQAILKTGHVKGMV